MRINNITIIVMIISGLFAAYFVIGAPDDSQGECENVNLLAQGVCDINNETGCWIDNLYPTSLNHCCGDTTENWYDVNKNLCCLGYYYLNTSDKDDSPCKCNSTIVNIYEMTSIEICDINGKTTCWNNNQGKCCGDDINETWTYGTSSDISKLLPHESCSLGKWTIRESVPSTILYEVWIK
jgi:hypothetical protein